MFIYISIFGFNFLISFIELISKKQKKLLWKFSFLILSFFLGFNYLNGIDWVSYQFSYINNEDKIIDIFLRKELRGKEYFIYIIMYIFNKLNFNYEWFQFVILTLILLGIYKFLERETKYKLLVIMIYFSQFMMSNFFEPILRQMIVMSLFFLATKYVYKKDIRKYFCVTLPLIFVHSSALFLWPLYFYNKLKIKFKNFLVIILIFTLLCYFKNNILGILYKVPFLSEYKYYLGTRYLLGIQINYLKILRSLTRIIALIIPIIIVEKKIKKTQQNQFILNMAWTYVILKYLNLYLLVIYRVTYYFGIFYCIILAVYINLNKKNRIIKFLIISSLYFRINILNTLNQPEKFYPYTNYIVLKLKGKTFDNPIEKIEYRKRLIPSIKK